MTSIIQLGKFERVPLTQAWPTEDGNFTPWLAKPDTIKVLGQALDMDLEVEAVEHWVGAFRADILARSLDETDHRVIIENQFGRTDHKHLGQILTYLAGIEGAKTVVWIAERIQSDHRAAIDWLNEHTTEEFSFFAIEIELWRIGGSPPAPRFNLIASPNDWAKNARSAARQIDGATSERAATYQTYWTAFADFLSESGTRFRLRTPPKNYWCNFAIGRSGFNLAAVAAMRDKWNSVEVNITHPQAKSAFDQLFVHKQAIEAECGCSLEWLRLDDRKASKIAIVNRKADPTDRSQWPSQHAWLLDGLKRLDKISPWISKLDLSGAEPDDPQQEMREPS